MFRKIEREERRAKWGQLITFTQILNVDQNELITLWLTDGVYEIVKDEDLAKYALNVIEKECEYAEKPIS